MSSKPHTDPVYKEKRIPKNPLKFHLQLNEEQKAAKEAAIKSKVTVIRGKAGSGKSLLAAQIALDLLHKKEVEKIIVSRPAVTASESIGFLPGSKDEKLAPFTAPVYDNMARLLDKQTIERFVTDGRIEVIPVGFLRGYNFSNCIVVVDEAQNLNHTQMELVLGRLCVGSKLIICGDSAQIDLKDKKESGFDFLCKHMNGIPGFAMINLQKNHRDPIVEDILKVYSEYRS